MDLMENDFYFFFLMFKIFYVFVNCGWCRVREGGGRDRKVYQKDDTMDSHLLLKGHIVL